MMPMYNIVICGLVLAALYTSTMGQLSFSTNWGSGKRSGRFQTRPQDLAQVFRPQNEDLSICFSQFQYNLLKEVNELLKREIERANRCFLGTKEDDYE